KTLTLDPGERRREMYPDLGGGDDRALRAHIEPVRGADAFALDDTAWALLPERKKQKVLLVSNDNLYLEAALLLDSNIAADKARPGEYSAELAKGYQVTVFDGWAPPVTKNEPPPSPGTIYFQGPFYLSPVPMRGELKRPFITDVNPDHPLTRWVTL